MHAQALLDRQKKQHNARKVILSSDKKLFYLDQSHNCQTNGSVTPMINLFWSQ